MVVQAFSPSIWKTEVSLVYTLSSKTAWNREILIKIGYRYIQSSTLKLFHNYEPRVRKHDFKMAQE